MNIMFADAIETNDIISVSKIINDELIDIDVINFFGIRIAAEKGYLDMVKLLHKYGADINTDYGYPLRWACRNEHYDIVKYLLENDAVIEFPRSFNKSIIYDAIISGNENIIALILYHGAVINTHIINYVVNSSNDSILNLILHSINERDINYILNMSTEVDIYDIPLITACDKNNVNMINTLIHYGANVNIFNGLPLTYCVNGGKYVLVKLLLDKGAKANLGHGIYYAVYKSYYDITKLLLDNGANASIDDSYLLRDCLNRGCITIAELLIQYGANINCNDNSIITDVLTTRNPIVIQFLKDNGVNFTLQEKLLIDDIEFSTVSDDIKKYNNNDNKCIICLENDCNVITPCGHCGCMSCYKEWFIDNIQCPVCKQNINILYKL